MLLDDGFESLSGVAMVANTEMSKAAIVVGHFPVHLVVELHVFDAFKHRNQV